ncbi:MAG: glycosyltransferase [Aigarchaeota archaeon]|nr:glycosyltransferase [Aigarchaeota archaeon]MDW8092646.1 glycosyltransferase [Nitrososphaerota archaeon]
MENSPFVSIIIPNYNGRRFLRDCLSSISAIDYPTDRYEVILVDNGSTDDSASYVTEEFPWVKTIRLSANHGYPGACNVGAEKAAGDLFVFLNNDTIVDKSWLRELVKVALTSDKVVVCGSKVLLMEDGMPQYAGGFISLIGGGIFYPLRETGKNHYFVGTIYGASFLIKRDVFKMLGGFEDYYFVYSDEIDLCYRTWMCGYSVAYCPSSIVYHYGGGTARRSYTKHKNVLFQMLRSPLYAYHGNRNSLVNILKNFEPRYVLIGLTLFSIYISAQLLSSLIDKNKTNMLAILKAIKWVLVNFRFIMRRRSLVQAKRVVKDRVLIESGVITSPKRMLAIRRFGKKFHARL